MRPIDAEDWQDLLTEQVKRDYEKSKNELPVLLSEPIRQIVAWGEIDSEVK